MSLVLALILGAVLSITLAAERALEIDPNTKTQGGADVSGSGANAGAGAKTDNKIETDKSAVGTPSETRGEVRGDKSADEKEKPVSERKPQERELEDAAKGETKPQQ